MRGARFLRPLAALAVLFGLAAGSPARADGDVTGVVELFTSQSCNSCPPADEVLRELAGRSDVVALAYHVDYWDYLGWADTFASPENTQRQKSYRSAFGARSVYTPQAVLNGRAQMNGADRQGLLRALKQMALAGSGPRVQVAVRRAGDRLVVDVAGDSPRPALVDTRSAPRAAHLLAIAFAPPTPVAIRDGENAGRSIVYWNAVRRIQPIAVWDGAPEHFELPWTAEPGEGAAVLLQSVDRDGLPGAILGAAALRRF